MSTSFDNDSDETEGRKLYRAIADTLARAQMNIAWRKVKLINQPLESNHMMDSDGIKWLTVAELRNVLVSVPDHYRVAVNRVGNLVVKTESGEYVGYIDFFEGKYTLPYSPDEDDEDDE